MMESSFNYLNNIDSVSQANDKYVELVKSNSMSIGVYRLYKKDIDKQLPHTEDEAYFVLNGSAKIQIEGKINTVRPGDIIFVSANQKHHFFDIIEDLKVLVFFAPAEYSNSRKKDVY